MKTMQANRNEMNGNEVMQQVCLTIYSHVRYDVTSLSKESILKITQFGLFAKKFATGNKCDFFAAQLISACLLRRYTILSKMTFKLRNTRRKIFNNW